MINLASIPQAFLKSLRSSPLVVEYWEIQQMLCH